MPHTSTLISAFLLLAAVTSMSQAQVTCPKIVTRSEWGARPANTSPLTVNPPTHVVIHHAASAACTTQDSCSKLVKSFQNLHIDTNGWADIGYNFLVGEDGSVYEGRGWGKTGAHAPDYNSKSIGICVIGTFTSKLPNSAALKAITDLVACGVSQGKIKSDYKLVGHRQVKATECPGNSLYKEIQSWPRWTASP